MKTQSKLCLLLHNPNPSKSSRGKGNASDWPKYKIFQRKAMNRLVKLCFVVFFILISGSKVMSEEEKEYVHYVNEIIRDFVREMERETGLGCIGSGGEMPHDVERIEVRFVEYRSTTLEEARALEVKAIQKLLKKINEHEKIRPFLREYPFNHNRVGISLSFQTNRSGYYLDGSIASVYNARDRIFYRKAEKKLILSPPIYNGVTGEIESPAEEVIRERLVKLMEEPYEDAVKIVSSTPQSQPFKKF